MGNGAGTRSTLARMRKIRYPTPEAEAAGKKARRAASNSRYYWATHSGLTQEEQAALREKNRVRMNRLRAAKRAPSERPLPLPGDMAVLRRTAATNARILAPRLLAARAAGEQAVQRQEAERTARAAAEQQRLQAQAQAQQRQRVQEEGLGRALTPAENRARLQALRDAEDAARRQRAANRAGKTGGRRNPQRFGSLQ